MGGGGVQDRGGVGKGGKKGRKKRGERGGRTSFETVSMGRSARRRSTTMEAMMPPWEWAMRTTFLTEGSLRLALMCS